MLEREPQLAAVRELIDAAIGGTGGVAVIAGAAGIGKTSLINAARAELVDRGVRVLAARGADLERAFAFGVMRSLFEAGLRQATPEIRARLLDGAAEPAKVALGLDDSPSAAVDASPVLLNALYWLVVGLSESAPLVIVVDDIHWADASSLRALAFLANRLESLPVALLLGLRTQQQTEDDQAVDAIRAAAVEVGLEGLSVAAIGDLLAERHGGELDDAVVQALHHATGGNPLWAQQAVEVGLEQGSDSTAPWSVRALSAVVLSRLGRMSADAVATAEAVAVLGDSAQPVQAAELVGLSIDQVLGGAAELAAAGLFDPAITLGFVHPMLSEAVGHDRGAATIALDHLKAARILRSAQVTPERIASHLLRAPGTGDLEAANDLLAAGSDALRRGAPDTAVAYLSRALQESPPPDLDLAVRVLLGLAEFRLGRFASAVEHLRLAAKDPAGDLDVIAAYALAVGFVGHYDELLTTLTEAAEQQSDPERRLALNALAYHWSWWLPPDDRPPLPAVPPPDELPGTTSGERVALATHAMFLLNTGDLQVAADLAARSLDDGALARDRPSMAAVAASPLIALAAAEWYDVFDREVAHLEAVGRITAASDAAYLVEIMRSHRDLQRGDLSAALESTALIDRIAASTPTGGNELMLLAAGYRLDALLGHLGAAAADAALSEHARPEIHGAFFEWASMWFLGVRSLVHLGCGRSAEALADAERHALGIGGHQGYPVPVSWWAALPLARAAAGDTAGAAEAARDFVARERTRNVPSRLAVALRARAAVEPDQRIALLEESVLLHETGGMRLENARSCVDLGVAYRRDGQRTAARAVLERGADLALGCQAGPLLETARSELRVLGARPRRAAFSGAESLTASERRVVDLAASGSTNREIAEQLFVTLKTVESHLARAYRKLDITSRDGLTAALA